MDDQTLFERALTLIEKYQLPLILALAGIICIGFGLLSPKLTQPKKEAIKIENTQENVAKTTKVDVSGAVKNPGVYDLSGEARVQDAVTAAGGFTDQVDSVWLSKNLNLAAKVIDGQKLYINFLGEVNSENNSVQGNQSININSASAQELDTLPGIGEITAEKIIDNRPYQTTEELLSKKIVGPATFEKIKDKISVY